jgi:hypothetical protein
MEAVRFSCICLALHRLFKGAPARVILQIAQRTCQAAHMTLAAHFQAARPAIAGSRSSADAPAAQ